MKMFLPNKKDYYFGERGEIRRRSAKPLKKKLVRNIDRRIRRESEKAQKSES